MKVENESNLSRVPYFYLPCGWSNPKVFVTHRYNYSHLRVGEWLFATLVNKQIILHACNVIYSVFIFLNFDIFGIQLCMHVTVWYMYVHSSHPYYTCKAEFVISFRWFIFSYFLIKLNLLLIWTLLDKINLLEWNPSLPVPNYGHTLVMHYNMNGFVSGLTILNLYSTFRFEHNSICRGWIFIWSTEARFHWNTRYVLVHFSGWIHWIRNMQTSFSICLFR